MFESDVGKVRSSRNDLTYPLKTCFENKSLSAVSTERAKTDVPTKDMCRERKVQEKILIEQCVPTELQKKNQRWEKYKNKSENKSLSAQTHTPPYPPLVSLTNTHFHVL